ncbi:polysaccharide deacetylase family protein [Deinococcus sp.]|uniref:polysaccharide deacetylase family protein n=1 Tax=Deinococcus sp. TaxID=47478 RepID=UPI0025F44E45|nr:polysaccharide deacetylase family protein [Deinococcus sp.]
MNRPFRFPTRFGVCLIGGLALATLLAEVLGRAAGLGALGADPGATDAGASNAGASNAGARNRVALTFDDGPSQRTTELLSVLHGAGVSATFFVLEDACQAHPAELQALLASAHQIEAHGKDHRHALRLWPWQEWAQVRWHPRDGAGAAPRLYRPPYGGHSPFTRLLTRLAGRRVALWDVESRDWTAPPGDTAQAQALAQATARQVRPGSVTLLHDGPAVTPELLRALLALLAARGLQPVRLSELPMRRIGLRAGLRRLRTTYHLS